MTMAASGLSKNIRKFKTRLEEEDLSDFERAVLQGQLSRAEESLRALVRYFQRNRNHGTRKLNSAPEELKPEESVP